MKTRWWMTGCTLQANSQEETQNEAQNEATNGNSTINTNVMPKKLVMPTDSLQRFTDEISECQAESQKNQETEVFRYITEEQFDAMMRARRVQREIARNSRQGWRTRRRAIVLRPIEEMDPLTQQIHYELMQAISTGQNPKGAK